MRDQHVCPSLWRQTIRVSSWSGWTSRINNWCRAVLEIFDSERIMCVCVAARMAKLCYCCFLLSGAGGGWRFPFTFPWYMSETCPVTLCLLSNPQSRHWTLTLFLVSCSAGRWHRVFYWLHCFILCRTGTDTPQESVEIRLGVSQQSISSPLLYSKRPEKASLFIFYHLVSPQRC